MAHIKKLAEITQGLLDPSMKNVYYLLNFLYLTLKIVFNVV